MKDAAALELLAGLADANRRPQTAARIADEVGARACLVLVRDPVVDAFVPAPGFPQTLPGGAGWRALLDACREPGRHSLAVAYPAAPAEQTAHAFSDGHAAIVLIGGVTGDADLQPLWAAFPLVARMLRCEQMAAGAAGEVRVAQDAARHARLLSAALSAARGDAERALAQAARLNVVLKDADRRKNEFLAMLAHELRNPLAPIVSALQLIRVRRERGETIDHELDVAGRQLSVLSRLVDDLLDVSRITRGKIELRLDTLSLTEVLAQAIPTAAPMIERRGHQLVVHDLDDKLFVRGDFVRLVQVFSNLLNNAAKYTDEGGRIEVVLERRDGRAAVRVRDNGIGLPPDILPHVFDLFLQAPRSLDRAQGGLGIGLTLVKALVEMHGGEVSAASDGEGRGSEFIVTLPLVDAVAARPAPPPSRLAAPRGAQLHVLVVDDNSDSADMLADVIRLWGHAVEVAEDGLVALRVAAQHSFDIILLDIGLPMLDGFEVARRLRPELAHTRLVALSGYGDEHHRERARAAGFDAYLVKPVDLDALQSLLATSEV